MIETHSKDSRETERYEVVTRKAYNHNPRDVQGTAIERLKAHADTEISNEDGTTMNCGVFTDLIHVCNYISEVEDIKEHRVYPAICSLGRDRCYHDFKHNGDRDVFTDIAHLIGVGKRSIDNPSKMSFATVKMPIFDDVRSTKFHTTKQTLAIAMETAKTSGILTSQLNLYHTLVGLKYMVENEPDYILIADKPLFVDVLRPLRKADNILKDRREQLQSWMGV